MSFSIKCNNCGREMSIKNNSSHLSSPIDFIADRDDIYREWLEIFCNNKLCNNEVRITI
jgi:hypothetical protein